mmetsp:Transcript_36084/g.119521  ORF Transcript_36084/g.119521 Transcript_36084/m.119521 type:complete len:288 (+) Transcript_36084:501-1364(+)
MHRARDAEQKGLGRSVRGLGWPRVKALDRAEVHDQAALPLQHGLEEVAHEPNRRVVVELDHLLQLLGGHVHKGAVVANASVVDQDRDILAPGRQLRKERLVDESGRVGLRQISRKVHHSNGRVLGLHLLLKGAPGISMVAGEDEVKPAASQVERNLLADAAVRAGHKCTAVARLDLVVHRGADARRACDRLKSVQEEGKDERDEDVVCEVKGQSEEKRDHVQRGDHRARLHDQIRPRDLAWRHVNLDRCRCDTLGAGLVDVGLGWARSQRGGEIHAYLCLPGQAARS